MGQWLPLLCIPYGMMVAGRLEFTDLSQSQEAPPLRGRRIGRTDEARDAAFRIARGPRPLVLVTRSTSGRGRGVALAMSERGAHVMICGTDQERWLEVVGQIAAASTSSSKTPGSGSRARADLLELTLAVNGLSHFLLTRILLPTVPNDVGAAGIWTG